MIKDRGPRELHGLTPAEDLAQSTLHLGYEYDVAKCLGLDCRSSAAVCVGAHHWNGSSWKHCEAPTVQKHDCRVAICTPSCVGPALLADSGGKARS